ncbi:GtrA family protein [Lichenihabitans sp. Uapishka_5]|uniref:GtrA family protein n=1 Tax=Lichenihabitans sp. Uapishka_5 TaxID=3037302 RepID=UPI0029E8115F|nr:GtrA family protein [Lichenihabitans sp. Uapishka_5]MDX7952633.1 GtrA family protein [Lichenihabitans sp. Uapishka_5]
MPDNVPMPQGLKQLLASEPVRFVVTGLGAAALLFGLTDAALRSPLPPFAGSLLAYGLTLLVSYVVQQAWTFRGRHAHRAALPRYCAAQALCAAGTATLAAIATRTGISAPAASLAAALFSGACSYGLSRHWVFAARRPAGHTSTS